MSNVSKGRGWPLPDAVNIKQITYELEKLLILDEKYDPLLLGPHHDREPEEVPLTARDGAVHILRCLKVLFDLDVRVFFSAVSFLDRFLTRMKVQQKFLACVTISCLYIASLAHKISIDPVLLVWVSQSRCSVKDLQRMSNIIQGKLSVGDNYEQPVTIYDYLMLFLKVFKCTAMHLQIKLLHDKLLQYEELLTRLEVVMADSMCAYHRPMVISLALIQVNIESFFSKDITSKSYYSVEMLQLLTVIVELQHVCFIVPGEYITCYQSISQVLHQYDKHCKSDHRQKLLWRFSFCTLNSSKKPSENFCNNLSTIQEE